MLKFYSYFALLHSSLKYLGLLLFILSCAPQADMRLVDHDGNEYTVKEYEGTYWMTENLRTKTDTTGKPLAYFYPNDDAGLSLEYGLLYDYETACRACPKGWQLPSNDDWNKLLQSEINNASAFKDNQYWNESNISDRSEFSARPAGYGNNDEFPNKFQETTLFWSDTPDGDHFVWTYILEKDSDTIRKASQHPTYAFSVRCVKQKSPPK